MEFYGTKRIRRYFFHPLSLFHPPSSVSCLLSPFPALRPPFTLKSPLHSLLRPALNPTSPFLTALFLIASPSSFPYLLSSLPNPPFLSKPPRPFLFMSPPYLPFPFKPPSPLFTLFSLSPLPLPFSRYPLTLTARIVV